VRINMMFDSWRASHRHLPCRLAANIGIVTEGRFGRGQTELGGGFDARTLSPLAGRGWGEGDFRFAQRSRSCAIASSPQLAESPPHPTSLRSVDLSPRAGRGDTRDRVPIRDSCVARVERSATRDLPTCRVLHGDASTGFASIDS